MKRTDAVDGVVDSIQNLPDELREVFGIVIEEDSIQRIQQIDATPASPSDQVLASLTRDLENDILALFDVYPELLKCDDPEEMILRLLAMEIEQSAEAWSGGIPLCFDEYCWSIDGKQFTPRQHSVAMRGGFGTPQKFIRKNRPIQEIIAAWGKGSGKDWFAARANSYVGYLLLNMKDPAKWFGRPGQRIDVLNVAPEGELAKRTYFAYLTKDVESKLFEPWVFNAKDQIQTTSIRFPQIDMFMYSLNSSVNSMDGFNPIFWTMDEADAFLDKEGNSRADRIRRILRTSATTRWDSYWLGFILSYIREAQGFMERLVEEGMMNPLCLVDVGKTWEINPYTKEDDPQVREEYRQDPVMAAAMYECIPPPVQGGYFSDPSIIDAATPANPRQAIAVVSTDRLVEVEMNNGDIRQTVGAFLESCLPPTPGKKYYAGMDGAEINDEFAISIFSVDLRPEARKYICHNCVRQLPSLLNTATYAEKHAIEVEQDMGGQNLGEVVCGRCYKMLNPGSSETWYINIEAGRRRAGSVPGNDNFRQPLPHVQEELLVAIQGIKARRSGELPKAVNFPSVQSLMVELSKNIGITQIRTDKHQLVQMMQNIQSETGVDTTNLGFSNQLQEDRARLCRIMLNSGLIEFLPDKDRDWQWKRIIRKKNGGVDHPKGGKKDKYDAETLAITAAVMDSLGVMNLSDVFGQRAAGV